MSKCKAMTKKGARCRRNASLDYRGYCAAHFQLFATEIDDEGTEEAAADEEEQATNDSFHYFAIVEATFRGIAAFFLRFAITSWWLFTKPKKFVELNQKDREGMARPLTYLAVASFGFALTARNHGAIVGYELAETVAPVIEQVSVSYLLTTTVPLVLAVLAFANFVARSFFKRDDHDNGVDLICYAAGLQCLLVFASMSAVTLYYFFWRDAPLVPFGFESSLRITLDAIVYLSSVLLLLFAFVSPWPLLHAAFCEMQDESFRPQHTWLRSAVTAFLVSALSLSFVLTVEAFYAKPGIRCRLLTMDVTQSDDLHELRFIAAVENETSRTIYLSYERPWRAKVEVAETGEITRLDNINVRLESNPNSVGTRIRPNEFVEVEVATMITPEFAYRLWPSGINRTLRVSLAVAVVEDTLQLDHNNLYLLEPMRVVTNGLSLPLNSEPEQSQENRDGTGADDDPDGPVEPRQEPSAEE